jgi:hypothetical protein
MWHPHKTSVNAQLSNQQQTSHHKAPRGQRGAAARTPSQALTQAPIEFTWYCVAPLYIGELIGPLEDESVTSHDHADTLHDAGTSGNLCQLVSAGVCSERSRELFVSAKTRLSRALRTVQCQIELLTACRCNARPFKSAIRSRVLFQLHSVAFPVNCELGHLLPHDQQQERFGRIGREYTTVLRGSVGIFKRRRTSRHNVIY